MRSVKAAGVALAAATVFALLLASMPDARAGGDGGQRVAPAQSVESCQQQEALRANPSAARSAIGGVALIQGRASVTRGPAASTLKVSDAIFRGDVLQTAADGTLGVTFNDATTFSLLPNSQITLDDFVYQEHGKRNVAAFEIIKGTVSFVASAVAKTGDMRIDTPSAAIGIRGTAGIVETGAASEMRIKLYPDADGHVGRIEVFGRDGSQLGVLTGGGTGFLVRAGRPPCHCKFRSKKWSVIAPSCAKPFQRNKRAGGSIYSVRICCGKIGSFRPVRDQAHPQAPPKIG